MKNYLRRNYYNHEVIIMQKRIFIKIDQYKDVVETLNTAKTKLEDLKNLINQIENIKEQEDSEIGMWKEKLEEIEEKVEFIDATLKE